MDLRSNGFEPMTFEDVLDEMMLEDTKPTHEALVRWTKRYPQFRKDLADFFAIWALQEAAAEAGVPEPDIDEEKIVEASVRYAMEILRKQGRIAPKDPIQPLARFDQLVLTAVYLFHGDGYVNNITDKVIEMSGKNVLLAFTHLSLDGLEKKGLVWGHFLHPKAHADDKTRRYYTITLAGERALAYAKETSKELADLLGDFA